MGAQQKKLTRQQVPAAIKSTTENTEMPQFRATVCRRCKCIICVEDGRTESQLLKMPGFFSDTRASADG
jgi:hypothetical protein